MATCPYWTVGGPGLHPRARCDKFDQTDHRPMPKASSVPPAVLSWQQTSQLWQGSLSRTVPTLAVVRLLSLFGFSGVFRPVFISQRLTREALQPLAGPVGGARQADHIAFLKRER